MLGVGAEGRSRVGDGLIDPEAIPGKNIDAAGIESAADDLSAAGSSVALAGEDVVASWGGLPAVYIAPEADDLYAVMASVGTDTAALDEVLSTAATALETLSADVATIVSTLETIRGDATDFVAEARDGYVVDFWDPNHPNWDAGWLVGLATDFADMKPARIRWDQYTPAVERNAELIALVDAQVVALSEAETECADAINALRTDTCVPSVVPLSQEALDAGGTRPWGDPEAADRSCYESAGDGFAGAANGAAHGVLALVGFDLDAFVEDPAAYWSARLGLEIDGGGLSWSLDTAGEAWGETGALAGSTLGEAALSLGAIALIGPVVPLIAGTVPSGPLGDAARAIQERQAAVAEGLIGDAETWREDPAEAIGALGFNVVTALIPGGGIVKAGSIGAHAAPLLAHADDVARVADDAARAASTAPATPLPALLDDAANVHRVPDDLSTDALEELADDGVELAKDRVEKANDPVQAPQREPSLTPEQVEADEKAREADLKKGIVRQDDFGALTTEQRLDVARWERDAYFKTFPTADDGLQYGTGLPKEYVAGLPEPLSLPLGQYTDHPPASPTYVEINGALRGELEMTLELQTIVEAIDKALAGAPPLPDAIVVSRGTGVEHLIEDLLGLTGETIRESGYSSTSLGPPAILGTKAQLHLRVPQGARGLYLGDVSVYGAIEREILFPRGMAYLVNRVVEDKSGVWQIFGEVIVNG